MPVAKYLHGDHVKVEFTDEHSAESEWLWVEVDHVDEENMVIFGKLDSQPVIHTNLKLGQELAISFDRVRDHRNFSRIASPQAPPGAPIN